MERAPERGFPGFDLRILYGLILVGVIGVVVVAMRSPRPGVAPPSKTAQEPAAPDVGSLLIPQRQLRGELRMLIDARLDLQRAVDELRLREIEHGGRSVVLAVAAPGEHYDAYALFVKGSDSLGRALLNGIGDAEETRQPAVDCGEHDGLSFAP